MFTEEFKIKTGSDFDQYYKKYLPKLVRFLTGISKDEDDAQDVATEAFVTSLNKIDSYDPTKAVFSTWLFTIAKRIAIQKAKEKSRFTSIDVDYDEGFSLGDTLKYDDTNHETVHAINYQKSQIIREMIPHLPEKYATVLTMRHVLNKSYQDIAIELGHFSVTLDRSEVSDAVISKVKSFLNSSALKKTYKSFYERHDEKRYKADFSFKYDSSKNGFVLFEKSNVMTYDEIMNFFRKHVEEIEGIDLNLNTVKSRIRQARLLLYKLTKEDFTMLDSQDDEDVDIESIYEEATAQSA